MIRCARPSSEGEIAVVFIKFDCAGCEAMEGAACGVLSTSKRSIWVVGISMYPLAESLKYRRVTQPTVWRRACRIEFPLRRTARSVALETAAAATKKIITPNLNVNCTDVIQIAVRSV